MNNLLIKIIKLILNFSNSLSHSKQITSLLCDQWPVKDFTVVWHGVLYYIYCNSEYFNWWYSLRSLMITFIFYTVSARATHLESTWDTCNFLVEQDTIVYLCHLISYPSLYSDSPLSCFTVHCFSWDRQTGWRWKRQMKGDQEIRGESREGVWGKGKVMEAMGGRG